MSLLLEFVITVACICATHRLLYEPEETGARRVGSRSEEMNLQDCPAEDGRSEVTPPQEPVVHQEIMSNICSFLQGCGAHFRLLSGQRRAAQRLVKDSRARKVPACAQAGAVNS